MILECTYNIHKYSLQFVECNIQVSHERNVDEDCCTINKLVRNEIGSFELEKDDQDCVFACEDAVLSYRLYLTYLASCLLLSLTGV